MTDATEFAGPAPSGFSREAFVAGYNAVTTRPRNGH
jgi:hypothetical protein